MDDPEFKVTVKHQTFGSQLNRIFAISPAFSGPAIYFPYIRLHVHINLKIRYLPVTNIFVSASIYVPSFDVLQYIIQVGKAGRFKNLPSIN